MIKKLSRKFQIILIYPLIFCLSGCAGLAMTAGGVVAQAGVDHSLSGIAQKTFTAPMEDVHRATMQSLERMEIPITDMNEVEPGWKIIGITESREVDVELEKITSNATRMQVIVKKHDDVIFKDSSTATEIIVQTAHHMN